MLTAPAPNPAPADAADPGGRRCAVWGMPIEHSLSPVLHRAAYATLGLSGWTYDRREVDGAGFADALEGLDGSWRGLSLTMPLKELGLASAVVASDTARATGGANTLVRHPDGWHAHNTDVHGILAALRGVVLDRPVDHAVVVGSGATARSAVAALAGLGVGAVTFVVRGSVRPETAAQAERAGLVVDVAQWGQWPGCDVAVSTVPPVAVAGLETFPDAAGPGAGVVLDVVYGSGETPLERVARAHGWRLARGVDMLLHQATEQVRLMTGRPAPLEAMRSALDEALGTASETERGAAATTRAPNDAGS